LNHNSCVYKYRHPFLISPFQASQNPAKAQPHIFPKIQISTTNPFKPTKNHLKMYLPSILKTLSTFLALTVSVTAIGNCKCQDESTQNDAATEYCCRRQQWPARYEPNEYHQVRLQQTPAHILGFLTSFTTCRLADMILCSARPYSGIWIPTPSRIVVWTMAASRMHIAGIEREWGEWQG